MRPIVLGQSAGKRQCAGWSRFYGIPEWNEKFVLPNENGIIHKWRMDREKHKVIYLRFDNAYDCWDWDIQQAVRQLKTGIKRLDFHTRLEEIF